MKDDGSGRKIAVHAIIGGIMSQITGAGFALGAVGAGLNEALIKNLKGKDPGTAPLLQKSRVGMLSQEHLRLQVGRSGTIS